MSKKMLSQREMQDIVKFWGSYEAYLEEQRRCGVYQLEYRGRNFNRFQAIVNNIHSFLSQPAEIRPVATTPLEVVYSLPQNERNHLLFLRWLYQEGRIRN